MVKKTIIYDGDACSNVKVQFVVTVSFPFLQNLILVTYKQQVGAARCSAFRRSPVNADRGKGEFQGNLDIFCPLIVIYHIWPTSHLSRRNRIPNSGANLKAVTNDECPVRVN